MIFLNHSDLTLLPSYCRPVMGFHFAVLVVLPLVLVVVLLAGVVVIGADRVRLEGRERGWPLVRLVAVAIDSADGFLERCYTRLGIWISSFVIGVALVFVVFLYVHGSKEPVSHGVCYAELSMAPFDVGKGNPFRYRIFAPLIGWALHLRGPLFVLVPWGFLVGFLALVNVWCNRKGRGSLLALSITLAMAFSPVTMHALVAPGWVDAVCYFLLGMALMNVRHTYVSCAFMAFAVMTHEVSIVLFPAWLMAVRRSDGLRGWWWFRPLFIFLFFMLPYLIYRWWVERHDGSALSVTDYINPQDIEVYLAVGPLASAFGIFGVFRLHWVLLAVPFFMLGLKDGRTRWALLLFVSTASLLLISFDTTRMLCWAFPVLVVGGGELGKRVGKGPAVLLVLMAWVLNFLIPPYTTTGAASIRLDSVLLHMEAGMNCHGLR